MKDKETAQAWLLEVCRSAAGDCDAAASRLSDGDIEGVEGIAEGLASVAMALREAVREVTT